MKCIRRYACIACCFFLFLFAGSVNSFAQDSVRPKYIEHCMSRGYSDFEKTLTGMIASDPTTASLAAFCASGFKWIDKNYVDALKFAVLAEAKARAIGTADGESKIAASRKMQDAVKGMMVDLGWAHETGKGAAKSDGEAVLWYRRAAEAGHPEGMTNLGWMLKEGRGVARNDEEAVMWFLKAALAGNASGMNNLGWMLDEGRGIKRSLRDAASWYRKAAEAGNAMGMNNLGSALQNGRGVPQNRDEAKYWYKKAVEAGNEKAKANLAALESPSRTKTANTNRSTRTRRSNDGTRTYSSGGGYGGGWCPGGTIRVGNYCQPVMHQQYIAPAPPTCVGTIYAGQSCR